jgi:hypothetical protein
MDFIGWLFSQRRVLWSRAPYFFCKCGALYNADNAAWKEGVLGCPVIGWIFITARRIGKVNLDERNGRGIEK